MATKKGTNWACVGYPESLPDNWKQTLQETGLEVAISPLHDKDIQPDGTLKKPHYHIILKYTGPTTYNNVKKLTDKLNMTIPIKLESIRGMYRYHIHKDDPDKYQYDDRDRILIGGFDPKSVEALTRLEVDKIVVEILAFIEDNDITEYRDLINQFRINNLGNLLDVATNKTILFNTYIKSKRHKELEMRKNTLTK